MLPPSQVGQRRGLQIINIMNNDGSLNSNAGRFSGLDRSEARTAVWEALEVPWPLLSLCSFAPLKYRFLATPMNWTGARHAALCGRRWR